MTSTMTHPDDATDAPGDEVGALSWTTPEQRHLPRLVAPLADGWTIGKRNLKHFTRLPRLLIFSTIQPVMFVLLFGYVFDGAVRGAPCRTASPATSPS